MHPKQPLRRLIVVSLHKAGAHLALRLIEELGYQRRFFDSELIESAKNDPVEVFLGRMEPNAAYFLHECRIDGFPRDLLEYWREHGDPAFIYQYRDPRAVLLSQVNYLRRRHRGRDFSNTAHHLLFSDVLQAQPDEQEAVDAALDCMGDYLMESFLGSVWMLHHPRVLKVRFENLVGAKGGGSGARQIAEVERVLRHLGVTASAERIAARLFDPSQRTFHRGRADDWKDVFTPRQIRTFEERYGHLLDIYGYRREHKRSA